MRFLETLKLAFDAIRAHKLRSFLTLLGMIVAVATFMIVLVFGAGTDYCLFLVSRYRAGLADHEDRRTALGTTSQLIAPVVVASGATVVLGFLGVLVIVRPGMGSFHPMALLVLASAIGFAITSIITKKLVTSESTFTILFYMNLVQLPLNLIGSDLTFLQGLGVAFTEGALEPGADLSAAVRDVTHVVHCAAKVGDWGPKGAYRQVNVGGLAALLGVAGGELLIPPPTRAPTTDPAPIGTTTARTSFRPGRTPSRA